MRRFVVAAALVSGAVVASAAPASAHTVTGVNPTNYKSEILAITPSTPGLSVKLRDLGRRVELTNRSAHDIVVLGYSREPYLRVGPGGVFENRRSPAVYQNRAQVAATTTATTLPRIADATAPPSWHKTSSGHAIRWRDRRTRWEGPAPAIVRADRGSSHVVNPSWTIELVDGGKPVTVNGRITWVPPPSSAPWLAVAALLFLAVLAMAWSREWGVLLSAALALLIAADAMHTLGLVAGAGGSTAQQAARLFGSGLVSILVWVLGAVGIGALQQQRETGMWVAAGAGFVVGLVGGIGDWTTLTRSQVSFAYPLVLARAAVVVSLGVGLGLAVAAVIVLRRHLPRAAMLR